MENKRLQLAFNAMLDVWLLMGPPEKYGNWLKSQRVYAAIYGGSAELPPAHAYPMLAADDLLAACESLVEITDQAMAILSEHLHMEYSSNGVIAQARAAIAKAKGQEGG